MLGRESFADEQAYLAYKANLARLERERQLEETRKRLAKAERKRLREQRKTSPAYQLMQKIKRRRRSRASRERWKARDPEGYLAHHREKRQAWVLANREVALASKRKDWLKHREHYRMMSAIRYREHRDEIIRRVGDWKRRRKESDPIWAAEYRRKNREYMAARPKRPGYIGRERRMAAARDLEHRVYDLKLAQMSWADIVRSTGRSIHACQAAYKRAKQGAIGEQQSA